MSGHTLSMLVKGNPDVLARIVLLFSTRRVVVESLSLLPTGQGGLSRLDVVVHLVEGRHVEQLIKQLNRLIDVRRVVELTEALDQIGA